MKNFTIDHLLMVVFLCLATGFSIVGSMVVVIVAESYYDYSYKIEYIAAGCKTNSRCIPVAKQLELK